MSRRKQQRPRHFESELEDLGKTVAEDITTHEVQPENDDDATIPSPTSDAQPHLCEFCHEEFWQIEELLEHKDNCINNSKRRRIMYDADTQDDALTDETNVPVRAQSVSDGEEMTPDEEDEGVYPEQFSEQVNRDFTNDKMDEDDFSEEETKEENKENKLTMSKQSKAAMAAQLPQLMSLANMANVANILPTSNVKLEPMSGTKAAVAQFAENNNLMPNDMAVLQATLFNLQQQQIVQLQLIQQLQHQIVTTKADDEMDEDEEMEGEVDEDVDEIESKSCETPKPSSPIHEPTSEQINQINEEENKIVKSESEKTSSSATSNDENKSYISSLAAMNNMTYNSLPKEMPIQRGSILPPHLLLSPPDDGYAQRGTVLERAQYASDDPFFKHKCRFCHKVFGSDSALQIHVRSHTGERPFKCHICGNRFSTKGNLKVHFERHKAKYPNARMNPTPVPEHLDRLQGSSMGMPMNPSSVPTSMPLPPGFMGNPMMPNMGLPLPMNPGFPMSARMPSGSMPSMHRPMGPMFSPINHSSAMNLPHPPPLPTLPSPNVTTNTHAAERPSSPQIKREKSSPPSTPQQNRETAPTPTSTSSTISSRASSVSEPLPLPPLRSPMGPRPHLPGPPGSFPLPSHLHPMASMAASIASSMASIASNMSSPFSTITAPSVSAEPSMLKNTILPTKMIDPSENLEEYMEVSKSETSKLEQLVKNIEQKITDPNQCLICHRVLSCKSALQMHYRIHTGERPFKCKICSRSFTTKGNLKTHMGVHRAKPPLRMMHQCPVCHKQFTNLLVLQQHIRMHTGEHGMPNMLPEHMYMHPEWAAMQQFDHKMMRPYDLSQGEPKELDLSNKSHRADQDMEDYNGYSSDDQKLGIDMDDDDDEEEEIDEEDRAAIAHENDDIERPELLKIKTDDDDNDLPKDYSSPNNDQSPPSSRPNSAGPPQSYYTSPVLSSSTSLAALEERVKAFDSQIAQSSFERFRYNMGLGHGMSGDKSLSPNSQLDLVNGDRSPGASPKSHSASENGSEYSREEMRPNPMMFPPGAGIPGFPMMGGMDMRPRGPDGLPHTTCNVCFKTFACRSALDIHYRSHTRERPYQCDVCERTFTTRGNMRQHMLTHKIRDLPSSSFNDNSNSKPSESSMPENRTETPIRENSHHSQSQGHSEKEPMKQSPESENKPSNANINNNNNPNLANNNSNNSDESPFARRNNGTKQHLCPTCHKTFSSGSALMIHNRTHTGDKPFKCNVCGKAFTTRGNLKVHMGTHMWNNSPSRRGRRMSIEPPFMMSHMKDNPYLQGFPQRPPDFYFQYPPFFNGLSPKMNDLSVLQSIQAGMGVPMHPGMAGLMPKMDHRMEEKKEERVMNGSSVSDLKSPEIKHLTTSSGELDLSMRSNSSGNSASASSSPQTKDSPSEGSSSPGSAAGGWLWKAGSCHICSQSFSSSAALEQHLQSHHLQTSASETQKAIVA
ncbi:hypothetical protein SNE40_008485 [Patella caerulea]|uniref:Homeotic protein spalt-major n=1 Tax=Patella caerulea TaxID=87958 RepID=A0AAN8PWM4_PATCE